MKRTLLKLHKAIKPESCARMRKRLRDSNHAMFMGRVMTTNIYQAMGKL